MKKAHLIYLFIGTFTLSMNTSLFAARNKLNRPSPLLSPVLVTGTALTTVFHVGILTAATTLGATIGYDIKSASDGNVVNQLKRSAGKPVPPSFGADLDEEIQENSAKSI